MSIRAVWHFFFAASSSTFLTTNWKQTVITILETFYHTLTQLTPQRYCLFKMCCAGVCQQATVSYHVNVITPLLLHYQYGIRLGCVVSIVSCFFSDQFRAWDTCYFSLIALGATISVANECKHYKFLNMRGNTLFGRFT